MSGVFSLMFAQDWEPFVSTLCLCNRMKQQALSASSAFFSRFTILQSLFHHTAFAVWFYCLVVVANSHANKPSLMMKGGSCFKSHLSKAVHGGVHIS